MLDSRPDRPRYSPIAPTSTAKVERHGGSALKQVREKLGIRMREVEEASRRIAEAKKNRNYTLSTPRLSQIENESSLPSIYKLYTLSVVYRISYQDLLQLYGINTDETALRELAPRPTTRLSRLEVYDKQTPLTFPVRLDPSFQVNRTQSLNRLVEIWGDIPLSFFQRIKPTSYQYGYVGFADRMMDPLIRPGSIVTIDTNRDKVQDMSWQNEFERPIYFVELRKGYRCSWCEMSRDALTLVPYPLSPCRTQTFPYPDEAEIVGQVVGVAMRLLSPEGKNPLAASRRTGLP